MGKCNKKIDKKDRRKPAIDVRKNKVIYATIGETNSSFLVSVK